MELRHLEHFVAVAEEQSFTKASHRLHIAQSALSVSIRALERDLTAQLFHRTNRTVTLTNAGAVLLEHARTVLADVTAARDAVGQVQGGLRGVVRVGILQSMVLPDLAEVFARFRHERPQVLIEPHLAPGGSTELQQAVAAGHLDVAFAGLPMGDYDPSLVVVPISTEPMVLVLPPRQEGAEADVIRLEDLGGEVFVGFPSGWGTRRLVDAFFAGAGLTREISIEVPDVTTAVELVRSGFGVAFLPQSTVSNRPDLSIRQVDPCPALEICIVMAPSHRRVAATRAFTDMVMAHYRVPNRATPGA
ncbi:LysR family transcriptional regulator [Dactylosporangium sp. NPDC005572]|uniref:LysR family transcriptional regulator n=1 Tax=Dactylosporangium sp. NPDC005572 TaxID=3156889 RepID=UPI0033ACBCDE